LGGGPEKTIFLGGIWGFSGPVEQLLERKRKHQRAVKRENIETMKKGPEHPTLPKVISSSKARKPTIVFLI